MSFGILIDTLIKNSSNKTKLVCKNESKVRVTNEQITSVNILNALQELGVEIGEIDFIEKIASLQMIGNSTWLISFVANFESNKLIGLSIKINDQKFLLQDSQNPLE